MPKRAIGRKPRNYRFIARLAILAIIISIYAIYWVYTPSSVEVARIQGTSDSNVMKITLHNPTFKVVTGTLYRIDTEVDVPRGNGETTVLQSIPNEYPFTLLPQSSQDFTIPFIGRILPGVDYDFYLRIDGVSQKTITVTLPKA